MEIERDSERFISWTVGMVSAVLMFLASLAFWRLLFWAVDATMELRKGVMY